MGSGLTKSEQVTLLVVTVLVAAGFFVQWTRASRGGESIWVESGTEWQPLEETSGGGGFREAAGATGFTALTGATTGVAGGAEGDGEGAKSSPAVQGESPAAVDVNRAGHEELQRLPGIGPAKAEAILTTRAALGGFRSAEDLLEVRGIGPATLDRMRPYLHVGAVEQNKAGAPAGNPAIVSERVRVREAGESGGRNGSTADGEGVIVRVNINKANAEELQAIPGVGPVLAGRIIDRRAMRPFRNTSELLEVRGIGPKTLAKMRAWVTVDGESSRRE